MTRSRKPTPPPIRISTRETITEHPAFAELTLDGVPPLEGCVQAGDGIRHGRKVRLGCVGRQAEGARVALTYSPVYDITPLVEAISVAQVTNMSCCSRTSALERPGSFSFSRSNPMRPSSSASIRPKRMGRARDLPAFHANPDTGERSLEIGGLIPPTSNRVGAD